LFKLLNEDGMCQELLHSKYLKNKSLAQAAGKPTDSPFGKVFYDEKMSFL
jgi:hypothetical protein